MELINATRMAAGYNVGLDPSGRELLVVVIKGTFVLPKGDDLLRLHDEQLPLVMADTFTGEPGASAPLREIDFAARKRVCDVLLTGHAKAPAGREVTRLPTCMRVGAIDKRIDIVGDRHWRAGLTGISASAPLAFAEMPVSYDRAFGGVDRNSDQESEHDAYPSNPIGRGWHKHLKAFWVDGKPLPNTEQVGKAVTSPSEEHAPMALGPLGRSWQPRARFAGTYDQAWLDEVFPFLPRDFDDRYYQAAPDDQQLPLPQTALPVLLQGFTADGERQFVIPHFEAPVRVFAKQGGRENQGAALDTIVFEPDVELVTLTWRLTRPLKKSIFEIAQVQVGVFGHDRWDFPPSAHAVAAGPSSAPAPA